MGIDDLYIDYGIETAPEEHKHHRDDWVNCACPHCSGSEGYHLGFNQSGSYYYCWRCGYHSIVPTIAKLLAMSSKQVMSLVADYGIRNSSSSKSATERLIKIGKKKFKLPSNIRAMLQVHRQYLRKRNFDPEEIENDWGVLGTSPMSYLDSIPYRYRLLIPIMWDGKMVSFQCRDYTNRQDLKYMACPMDREIIHHKHILYGWQNAWSKVGICVEGIFDVWRLGSPSFATFGIGYTREQVRLISKLFTRVIIVFDPEPQAQEQAHKLRDELMFRGIETHVYEGLASDPADLSPDDAKHLVKEITSGGSMVFS